ncbi:hypothetical protein HDU84_003315 [Entophlyctis sp. JEL0112]|nr:hypothetical protein HDU84_003315 [Entophlyctis sp. JEL0112]
MVPATSAALALAPFLVRAVSTFETQAIDGTGNNIAHPLWGSTGDAFIRSVPPAYGPDQTPAGLERPNARLVSNALFGLSPAFLNDFGTSDFLTAWGVYVHLDVTFVPKNDSEPFPIQVPQYDPNFDPYGTNKSIIPMSRASFISVDEVTNSRVMANAFTCFLDGSALYGNSEQAMNELRSYSRGKLKSVEYANGAFPPRIVGGQLDGYFAFSIPNVNISPVGPAGIQTLVICLLLFREHNRRADVLYTRHPDWNDEQIFQRARRWVIAIIQRISVDFYLPTLTGGPLPVYSGYNPDVNPQIDLFFSQVAYIYGHTGLNQIIQRLDETGKTIQTDNLLLRDSLFKNLCDEVLDSGMEPILRGFVAQRDNEIDTRLVEDVRNNLPLGPNGAPFDLAAIGIQRGRDLGFPDYNSCRAAFNLTVVKNWEDLTNDTEVQNVLAALYQNISNLDVSVGEKLGTFAESHIGNSLVGPLAQASIREQFQRLRDGDRYWYENDGVLTDEEEQDFEQFGLGDLVTLNTNITYYPGNPFVAITDLSYFLNGPEMQAQTNYIASSVSVLGVLRLSWNISDAQISFIFESNSTGWFGFGLGNDMLNSDIYFCNDNGFGVFEVQDSWSNLPLPIQSDVVQGGQNNILHQADLTKAQNQSLRVVSFTRYLRTGDQLDYDITNSQMPVIFAYSHAVSSGNASSGMSSLLILHSLSMYIAFVALYPLGIYVARYHHNMAMWLPIHTSLLSSVTSNVVVAGLTAIIGTFGNPESLHYKFGLGVITLVCLSTAAGYIATKLYSMHYRYSGLAYAARGVHKYSGLLAYVVGLVDCYLGVSELGDEATRVYYQIAFLITVFIPPIALYVYGERQKQRLHGSKDFMGLNNLPLFKWEDVNQRVSLGAKWIVIDDIISKDDVKKFIDRHPGGPHALHQMIGVDAAFAFNGRYRRNSLLSRKNSRNGPSEKALLGRVDDSLEELVYNHSRYARNLLASFAIATLSHKTQKRWSMFGSQHHSVASTINDKGKENLVAQSEGRCLKKPVYVDRFMHFIIAHKKVITQPKARFPVYSIRVAFENEEDEVFSQPGDSYLFQFVDNLGRLVTRSYTPTAVKSKGGVDFMIKMYNGEMTNYLMKSQSIRMRGPISKKTLLNPYSEFGTWKTLGLIAGGSGITPMLLIIDYHIKNCIRDAVTNKPNFHIHLLYSNVDEADIFATAELTNLEVRACGALTITYIVKTTESEDFAGIVGSISPEIILATMPKPQLQQPGKRGQSAGSVQASSLNRNWNKRTGNQGIGEGLNVLDKFKFNLFGK